MDIGKERHKAIIVVGGGRLWDRSMTIGGTEQLVVNCRPYTTLR